MGVWEGGKGGKGEGDGQLMIQIHMRKKASEHTHTHTQWRERWKEGGGRKTWEGRKEKRRERMMMMKERVLPHGFELSLSEHGAPRVLTLAGVIRLVWSRMKGSETSDINVTNPMLRTSGVFADGPRRKWENDEQTVCASSRRNLFLEPQ